MSASRTDSALKGQMNGQKHPQPSLRDLLSQHESNAAVSSCEGQKLNIQKGQSGGGAASLAQLMSEHELKGKGSGWADAGGRFSASSPSGVSKQSSLSLGTLASLNGPLALNPPPSSIFSLGNLSLNDAKTAVSPLTPFMSLGTVLQSSQQSLSGGTSRDRPAASDHKVSPSLSDLIQEHSQRTQPAGNTLPGPRSREDNPPAAPTVSLSDLALQHQNKNSNSVSQTPGKPRSSSSLVTSGTETLSLSALALQHQNNGPSAFSEATGTQPAGSLLQPPPGLAGLLSVSQHKGKTSTTSNGSQYSLASLLSPAKPEKTAANAESITGGAARCQPDRKPDQKSSRPRASGQTIDLTALMAQSHGAEPHQLHADFPSPWSPTPRALGLDLSVFARPSVFAVTLSVQTCRAQKKKRDSLKRKLKGRQDLPDGLMPFPPVAPFLFDTPSPDDIIRAKQRKAFTR